MTNIAILETTKALHGITEDCHTFQTWKQRGRKVKRGEKAAFYAPMWKPRMKKDEDGEETRTGFFTKQSAFFKASQTEPIA